MDGLCEVAPDAWPPLGRCGAASTSTPRLFAIARPSAPALSAMSFSTASLRTAPTGCSVRVQSVELPSICAAFCQIDWRMSANGGDDMSASSSAARRFLTRGVSTQSARPITIMLLPGTWFSTTPGSTTSLAEYATPPAMLCAGTARARRPSGSRRESLLSYHQGMPFCTKTTAVSRPSSGAHWSAKVPRLLAFRVTNTASCAPSPCARSDARTRPTMVLPPCTSLMPLASIASRCAPRATTQMSWPWAASFAARWPPTAPAPKMQMRMLERDVDGAAVDEQVLPHDEAGVLAAEECASAAELLGRAEAVGRHLRHAGFGERFVILARLVGELGQAIGLAPGREGPRQEVIDDDVVFRDLPREPGDKAGEAGARAIRKAEMRKRRLYRARGDVDDAPEAPRDHAVDHGAHQHDRRDHVVVHGALPRVLVPVAEIAYRRASGVVDQDVGLRTRCEHRRATFGSGDVARHGNHLAPGGAADLVGRRLQRCRIASVDDQLYAFVRERKGATLAEPLAGCADDRFSTLDAEIHSVGALWKLPSFMIARSRVASCRMRTSASGSPSTSSRSAR